MKTNLHLIFLYQKLTLKHNHRSRVRVTFPAPKNKASAIADALFLSNLKDYNVITHERVCNCHQAYDIPEGVLFYP